MVGARARHRDRLPARDQLPQRRPPLLRDRLQPRRGAADRPADPADRLHRLRPLGRALRASPASCSWRASATSRSRPAAASSCRSVAAVVVGGVNIFGGSGTIVGAMLGAVMIGTLEQSLFRLQISEFWRDAVLGLLILLAVASDAVILQRLRTLWARTELKLLGRAARPRTGRRAVSALRRLRSWEGLLLALLVVVVAFNIARSPYYLGVGNIVNLFQLDDREDHRRPDDDARHHRRRDRPLGRLGHGPRRPASWPGCSSGRAAAAGPRWPRSPSGALAGLFNGFWVAYVGLPSLAVTLAGLIGYRGVARILVEDRADRRLPALVQRARPAAAARAADRSRSSSSSSCFVVVGRRAARLGARPAGLRDRQQRSRRRATRACASAGQDGAVRRLGHRRGAGRAALRGPARLGARRHGRGLRARHHHRRAARRGQHLRRLGQLVGVGLSILRDPQPPQRHGSRQHHRQHPDQRDRGPADPVGAGPEHGADQSTTDGEGERHEEDADWRALRRWRSWRCCPHAGRWRTRSRRRRARPSTWCCCRSSSASCRSTRRTRAPRRRRRSCRTRRRSSSSGRRPRTASPGRSRS